MSDVLASLEHVKPEWLTEILRKRGYLAQGRVSKIRQWGLKQTPASQIVHLEVDFSQGVRSATPSKFFLKTTKPGLQEELAGIGEKEVKFYNEIATKMNLDSLVYCYEAAFCSQEKRFHLLMEDLSETHFKTSWPLPPTQDYCVKAIESLADIHAFWQNNPQAEETIGAVPTDESLQRYFHRLQQILPDFLDFLQDRLSSQRRKLYQQILQAAPNLTKRFLACKGLTLVHNDAHCWNFLFPHDLEKDRVKIIDWQVWFTGLAMTDLAYMIGVHWYPERRARLEIDLLKGYHNQLLKAGVVNYDWHDCWYEYRLSIATNIIFIPMLQWHYKLDASIWWSHLERAILAFEDLDCVELLST